MHVVVAQHGSYPRAIELVRDIALPLAVFALVTALAAALGAANFGTALGIGQVAFVGAVTWVLLRR